MISFSALRSKFARDMGWVLGGQMAGKVFSFLSFVVLARGLGPQDFGYLSIGLVALSMVTELSELGINLSAIRFGARHWTEKDWTRVRLVCSIVLRSRLAIGASVFVLGNLLAGWLAGGPLGRPEVEPYLRLAFAGIFGTILLSAITMMFQMIQRFDGAVRVSMVASAASFVGFLTLSLVQELTPWSALWVAVGGPLCGVLFGALTLPQGLLTIRGWDRKIASQIFHFGKWMALWSLFTILESRIPVAVLSKQSTVDEVGLFQAAWRIALLAQMVSMAYGTVLFPKISTLSHLKEYRQTFRKSLLFGVATAGAIGIGSLLSPWIVPLVAGQSYVAAVPALQWLFAGMAFFALNIPFSSTLYALERSRTLAFVGAASLGVVTGLNLFWAREYGALGAARAMGIAQLMVLLVSAGVVLKLLFRSKK